MDRRHFVLTGTVVATAGLAGCSPAPIDGFATLEAARNQVLELLFKTPVHDSPWSLSQLLQHLAQSVEYSMQGYPEMKGGFTRAIAGGVVFPLFNAWGGMRHSLTEPIPGAAQLDAALPLKAAVERLISALASFEAWPGPLKPHFAYGELDKTQYARAHLMHLANHWTLIKPPAAQAKP